MSNSVFSIRNILTGVALGLVLVALWFGYRKMTEQTRPHPPEIVQVESNQDAPKPTPTAQPAEPPAVAPGTSNAASSSPAPAGETSEIPATLPAPVVPTPASPTEPAATSSEPALQETAASAYLAVLQTVWPPYDPAATYAKEEQQWRELLARPLDGQYVVNYPFAPCFQEAANQNGLPLALVLGMAGLLSNYDPGARLDDQWGVMMVKWPEPASELGVAQKEQLTADACQNIQTGCRFMRELLKSSQVGILPTLLAYRAQTKVLRPESVSNDGLKFLERLRKRVEQVLGGPYQALTMYPFWRFDARVAAENLLANIEEKTGLTLWLDAKDSGFTICIPARDEADRSQQAETIKNVMGLEARP